MITESDIYWLTRLDGIRNFEQGFGIALLSLAIIAAGLWICGLESVDDKEEATTRKFLRLALVLFVVSPVPFVARVFTPTTKEMCAIKLIPKVVNSEGVQEIPEKLVGLSNEWIEELRPKKKDGK